MQSSKLWITTASSKKTTDFIAAVLTVLLLVGIYHSYTSFVFSTNDDLFIKSIVSGEVTGKPEFRCIYLGVLPGLVLSRLYLIFSTIPWYGIFLCFCQMLAMLVVLYQCLQHARKIASKIVILLLFGLISGGILLQHFAMIQFTVVASIVGAASVFSFYVTDDEKQGWYFLKANIPSFLLFVLSVSIRDKAAFMLLPMAGMLWLFKWLNGSNPFNRKRMIGYFGYMGITLALLGGIKLVDKVAYAGEDWQEFWSYTHASEQIVDYYGYPDYEKHKELYDQYGISYESYEGAAERYLLLIDENINAKSMQAMETAVREDYNESHSIQNRIRDTIGDFVARNLDYTDRPLNLFVYAAYAVITVLAFIRKKYKVLLCECLLLVGRMCSWLYLFWQGRYPERITQGLYFGELLALLAIGLSFQLFSVKKKISLVICIGLFSALSLYFGIHKAEKVQGAVQGRLFNSTAYSQLKEYCMSHPQNLYLLDMRSVEYYTEDILEKQEYRNLNFVTLGSWIPKSPLYTDKLDHVGIHNLEQSVLESENIYFVFKDEKGLEPDYLYDYFREKYPECSFKTADVLKADNGNTFLLIQLQ